MNFDWRIWKFKIHDKMTINHDHYDIALFEVIVVINWIDDEIEKHIQVMRNFDINYFKSHEMMMKYLEIIFSNFDYKRKTRIEFRALIMNIRSFQKFFSNFLRLNVAIEYNENTKFEKLHEKLSIKLKNVLSNNSREFFILIEIRIELSKIYNNQKKIRRQRIEKKIARLFRFEYTQSKFTFVTSMSWEKFRLSFILSTRVHMRTNVNLTHISTFDIWSSCTSLLFKSNIHVFVIVTSSQTRSLTLYLIFIVTSDVKFTLVNDLRIERNKIDQFATMWSSTQFQSTVTMTRSSSRLQHNKISRSEFCENKWHSIKRSASISNELLVEIRE